MKVRIVKDVATRIFIDDVEIHRVFGYKLEESVDQTPILTLELNPREIEVDTEAEVDTLEKEKIDGYKEFVKFLFRGKGI